jgi:glycosyltransferase involved in cell wall biosynthesis
MRVVFGAPCNDDAVSQPPRALLVIANGGPGGMQVQVGLLAHGLRAAGWDVTVAAGPGDLDVGDVELRRLPELSAGSLAHVLRSLRGVVADLAPTIVHGHGLRLAPLLAASAHRRALVTCHGIDPARARRAATLARFSRVPVASCGEGPRRLLAAAGLHSRVLDNAVAPPPEATPRAELAREFGLDESLTIAVSPARLTPQKDPVTLVRALAAALDVAGVLIGDGPLASAVRDEVTRLGVADRVVVSPWRADARSLLGGADLLALASKWEGQPTVVLEAMAAGIPVVVTSCTGTADTVVDGLSGLLAPVGDAAALAVAMSRVASDRPLRDALVAVGRAQAVDHEASVVVAQHLDAYERVAAGRWR